jgi:predicted DNA-binding transcriptional regulator AlpA
MRSSTSKLLRFNDLKERGIVGNWPMVRRLIEHQGFPPGIRVGAQSRAWPEAEIDAWLESRRISAPPSKAEGGE